MQSFFSEEKLTSLGDTVWICSVTSLGQQEGTVRESDLAPVFPPLLSALKYDTSRKTVGDKCDHSRLCALLQMWWLHTTMRDNGKWHSWVQIISRMNAFFRSHYSDVPTCTQQTHPTTNAGIWRRVGGVLSLSFHDKSVCISTPFITSLSRQWIEFQKPINKGDVHSAWQLSQGNVPLSFAPPPPTHTPASFLSFLFSEISRERDEN